ncbi:MAG: PilN domain-containing protein [Thermodesulfovibrionales bacterium]|nr:PilN domain-containing protein [Thermodesulfovibrionales bacterium]
MNILSLDIRQNEINYAIYRKTFSPLYFITGNPFAFPLFIKEIKRGNTRWEDLPSIIEGLKKEPLDCMILGLPFYKFNHHIIDLPLRSEKEIKTALAFELEKKLPLPVDQYLYNFTFLKKTGQGSTLLCLSIRKEHLLNIIEPLRNTAIPVAGISCTFTTEIIHIARKNRGRLIMAQQDGEYIYLACLLDSEIKALRLIRRDEEIEYPFGFQDPSIPAYLLRSPNIKPSGLSEERDERLKHYQTIELNPTELIIKTPKHLQFIPDDLAMPFRDIRLKVAGAISGTAVIIFLLTDLLALYKEKRAYEHFTNLVSEIKELRSTGPLEERSLLINRYSQLKTDTFNILSALRRTLPRGTILSSVNIDIQNRLLEIEGRSSSSSSVLQALESSGFFKNISYSGAITVKEGKEVFRFRMEIK